MTKEQLEKEIFENKQKMQLDFIKKLEDMVEHYAEKTIKSSYIPSIEEKFIFGKIVNIVNNVNKYL
jgi:hypothetical protein